MYQEDIVRPEYAPYVKCNPAPPTDHYCVEVGTLDFGDMVWNKRAERWQVASITMCGHPVKDLYAVARHRVAEVTPQAEADFQAIKAAMVYGSKETYGGQLDRRDYEKVWEIIYESKKEAIILQTEALCMSSFLGSLPMKLERLVNPALFTDQQYLNFVAVHLQKEEMYGRPDF